MPHDVELGFYPGAIAKGGKVWLDGQEFSATKIELLAFDGSAPGSGAAKLRLEIACRSIKTRDVGPQGEVGDVD